MCQVYGFIGGSTASKNNFGRRYGFIIIILLSGILYIDKIIMLVLVNLISKFLIV